MSVKGSTAIELSATALAVGAGVEMAPVFDRSQNLSASTYKRPAARIAIAAMSRRLMRDAAAALARWVLPRSVGSSVRYGPGGGTFAPFSALRGAVGASGARIWRRASISRGRAVASPVA